jgi:hypothetical protein
MMERLLPRALQALAFCDAKTAAPLNVAVFVWRRLRPFFMATR